MLVGLVVGFVVGVLVVLMYRRTIVLPLKPRDSSEIERMIASAYGDKEFTDYTRDTILATIATVMFKLFEECSIVDYDESYDMVSECFVRIYGTDEYIECFNRMNEFIAQDFRGDEYATV